MRGLAVGGQTGTGGMVGVLRLEHTDFPQAYRLKQRSYVGGVAGVKQGVGLCGLLGRRKPVAAILGLYRAFLRGRLIMASL